MHAGRGMCLRGSQKIKRKGSWNYLIIIFQRREKETGRIPLLRNPRWKNCLRARSILPLPQPPPRDYPGNAAPFQLENRWKWVPEAGAVHRLDKLVNGIIRWLINLTVPRREPGNGGTKKSFRLIVGFRAITTAGYWKGSFSLMNNLSGTTLRISRYSARDRGLDVPIFFFSLSLVEDILHLLFGLTVIPSEPAAESGGIYFMRSRY